MKANPILSGQHKEANEFQNYPFTDLTPVDNADKDGGYCPLQCCF